MATTIGKLATILTANTMPFQQGLQKAAGSVASFAKKVANVAQVAAKFGVAVGAAAAAGIVVLTKKAFASIDATAKMSDKLGIATEKLIGLRHAATQSGVGADTLDMALQRMTRRLSEAALGGGEALGAIKELGLNAQALASASPDQAFRMIADAMEGVKNPADRVRLAFKFFDSEGVSLVNTLRGGSDAIDAMQKEAEDLHMTFNRVDAAKVEAANDAMARLFSSIKNVGMEMAIRLAPIVEEVANRLSAFGAEGEGMGAKVVSAVEWMAKALVKPLDIFHELKVGLKGFQMLAVKGFDYIIQSVIKLAKTLQDLANHLPGVSLNFDTFFTAVSAGSAAAVAGIENEFNKALLEDNYSDRIEAFFRNLQRTAQREAEKKHPSAFDPVQFDTAKKPSTPFQAKEFGQQVRFRSEINANARGANDPLRKMERLAKEQRDAARVNNQQNNEAIGVLNGIFDSLNNFSVLTA